MAKWQPNPKVFVEPVSDAKYAEILAELGQLIYDHICQLPNQTDSFIAPTPLEIASQIKRKVANEAF